jgi:hypothetical protein
MAQRIDDRRLRRLETAQAVPGEIHFVVIRLRWVGPSSELRQHVPDEPEAARLEALRGMGLLFRSAEVRQDACSMMAACSSCRSAMASS